MTHQRAAETKERARLVLDPEGFAAAKRPAIYEIADALLMLTLVLQAHFGLRAETFQVFFLIAMATAQPLSRAIGTPEGFRDTTPLPRESVGGVSRRRIAELLGIPTETVRRHVADLIAAGLIVESRRGRLSTPGGTLRRLDDAGLTDQLAARVTRLANTLIRLGVMRVER